MAVVVSIHGDSFDVLPFVAVGVYQFSTVGRASGWGELARETVEQHPYCSCCRAERDLQVHHVRPVHLFPAEEMMPHNLLVLCRRCHLFVGHLGDTRRWNPMARSDASKWRRKIGQAEEERKTLTTQGVQS